MKKSQATAKSNKTKKWGLSSIKGRKVWPPPLALSAYFPRPMQLMSTDTPHQSRNNSLVAFISTLGMQGQDLIYLLNQALGSGETIVDRVRMTHRIKHNCCWHSEHPVMLS